MRFIGIKVYGNGYKDIPAGYYPIGDLYSQPNENDYVVKNTIYSDSIKDKIESIYDTDSGVHVTVSAIVCRKYDHAKQLMDMLFIISQYFNVYMLHGSEWNVDLYKELPDCKVYLEIEDDIYFIYKHNDRLDMYRSFPDSQPEQITDIKGVLGIYREFDYTIDTLKHFKCSVKNAVFMFDEIKMHLHPEEQRTLIGDIILNINKYIKNTKNVHILIFTHSPFVLMDVFKHNTLYLNESCKNMYIPKQTFMQNIHEIMRNMGICSIVGEAGKKLYSKLNISAELNEEILPFIGDEFLRMTLVTNHSNNY